MNPPLGRKLTRKKQLFFFNKATLLATKNIIMSLLGMQEIKFYEKYLGLPSLVGRGKRASFNYIKERVWRKLQGWEGKLLSQVGREVLIKSIIQAIPTFAMGYFKLPIGLCHEIEAMLKKIWWGQHRDRRKIQWIRWEELTKSKLIGGMGFKDLILFNDALLAKQTWWLLTNTKSLFYKVFKAKFLPHWSILYAKESIAGSYAWKSIIKGRDVILNGAFWRVGDGRSIKIWQHWWLPIKHHPKITSPILESMEEATVDCLINPDTRSWNHEMIDGIFIPLEADLIKKILLSKNVVADLVLATSIERSVFT